MKKKFRLFSFILLLTVLIIPFGVNAEVSGYDFDEDAIFIELPSEPAIGGNQVFLSTNQYITVLDQYWVNETDHRKMTNGEKFVADKQYTYVCHFNPLTNRQYVWFYSLLGKDHYLGGGSSGTDTEGYATAHFYMGDTTNWEDFGDEEDIKLDIDAPVLGETPGLARESEYYEIKSENWENITDERDMTETDVFEEQKRYKYTITFETYYDYTDFLENFRDSEAYLGFRYDYINSPYEATLSGYFYFGNAEEDLVIQKEDVIIDESNPPAVGGVITLPTIRTTGNVDVMAEWRVLDDEFYESLEDGTEVELGETYIFEMHLEAEPGYHFADDFEVVDYNMNQNFVTSHGDSSDTEYVYYSQFTILPEGSTIGISGDKHLIYPEKAVQLAVFPPIEENKTVTWTSSVPSVATVDETGWVVGVAPGTTTITATNSLNESATYDIEVGIAPEEVEVQTNSITLFVGEEARLRGAVLPEEATDQNIDWVIDNFDEETDGDNYDEGAVILQDDTIRGFREGVVRIIAYAHADHEIFDVVNVTVKARPIEVDKVVFEQNRFELYERQTATLVPIISPSNATDQDLTWEVTGNNVISFDEETLTITALAPGTGRITAKTSNNKYATAVIQVKQKIDVQEITFPDQDLEIELGEEKGLELNILPANAFTEYVLWVSDNPTIVSVDDNGKIVGLREGTATITATTDNNKTANIDITVVKPINFNDVSRKAWYYESVRSAYNRGIIAGYGNNRFGPTDKVTRGQLVTFLYRIEGEPDAVQYPNDFKDVPIGQYYTDAVKWAAKKGIVHGYGNTGTFGPGKPIIRQDLAVILNNYAKYLGLDYTTGHELDGFADYNLIKGKYAEPALAWAVHYRVMNGAGLPNGKRAIQPLNHTTRAEAAAMIVNFLETFDI